MRTGKTTLLIYVLCLAFAAGCGEVQEQEQENSLAIKMMALDSPCSSPEAAAKINRYCIKVMDNSVVPSELSASDEFGVESMVLKLCGIPESSDLELTMLGFGSGGQPVSFAKAKNLVVSKNETTSVALTRLKYADFSCVDTPGGAANRMFHTVTALPDGRVFVAGGFTKTTEENARFELGNSSDQGFVFNPADGKLEQSANLMNKGRGAHAAVYLPKSKLVLLVGGADMVFMEKDNSCFPWYWLKEKAGDVGLTYELFDPASMKFLAWDSEQWPDEGHEFIMQVRRIFPVAVINNDGTVLVTGGGYWPSCGTPTETDADYRIAELYRPKTANYTGGFMNSYGALTMKGMRSGHTGVLMEVKDKLAYHLFWGGSPDGPLAEVYQESSGQMDGNFGAFKEVNWLDSSSYKKRPYFHTMTTLKDRMFLLVGGVTCSSNKLKVPSAADAYQVKVMGDQKIGVTSIKGLVEGRYFHSATTYDLNHVVIFGGFSALLDADETFFAGGAINDMRFYDMGTELLSLPPIDAQGLPRGGLGAAALSNDCIFMAGGIDQPHVGLEFQTDSVPLVAEVYCPSSICPEGLWDTCCYQE